jgi:hypothetical protein
VLVSILAVTAATVVVLSTTAVRLRWDGQCWFYGAASADGPELAPTELTVAVDLGGWMLLRLQADGGASRWSRTLWLPAQRRGHETHWHALRCAVYSPRPAPGGPSAADP